MKKNSSIISKASNRNQGESKADIDKINKKVSHFSSYQEYIENKLQEESKLRENVEKKYYVMFQNFEDENKNLKQLIDEVSKKCEGNINSLKTEILVDAKNENNKILSSYDSYIDKLEEYQRNYQTIKDDQILKLTEFENKLSIFEELTCNQYTIIKNEISATNKKLSVIEQKINSNTTNMNSDITKIKEDIFYLKNEIEMMKGSKNTMGDSVIELKNQISIINNKNDKISHDMDIIINDVQNKLKNYENINKMLNESFMSVKNDVVVQIENLNKYNTDNYGKIKDNLLGEIKKNKVDMDKFHINIIQENQKFIEYSENQMKTQNENVKKLFDYTNEDIQILKKKSDTLENIIKNVRNEMINNINNVEGFLTQRYDNIFKTMNMSTTQRSGII